MGSATYEWMLRHALQVKDQMGTAWPYAQPTWVFSSRTLPRVDGANLFLASGDVRPVHEQMRAAAAGKNVWIVGGGDLAGTHIPQASESLPQGFSGDCRLLIGSNMQRCQRQKRP